MADKHLFAIFYPGLSDFGRCGEVDLLLEEPHLVHRFLRILRVSVGDEVILFDRTCHALVAVLDRKAGSVQLRTLACYTNRPLLPHIGVLLPVLTESALEEAVYQLTEVGVNEIKLIHTEKTKTKTISQAKLERLQRIVVSAAEQSKNFLFPKISSPFKLTEKIFPEFKGSSQRRIILDAEGSTLSTPFSSESGETLLIISGPEGGLTQTELALLDRHGFQKIRLTQTVLRARTAPVLFAGMIRSLV